VAVREARKAAEVTAVEPGPKAKKVKTDEAMGPEGSSIVSSIFPLLHY